MVDKHNAMILYLLTCPIVKDNPLFFNFGSAEENNNQFITTSNAKSQNIEYIDGSVEKSYLFTLLTFKTISYNAIVKTGNYQDENMSELLEAKQVVQWIDAQNDARNFPDFGSECVVDEIQCTTADPVLVDVDNNAEPAIATYSITIQVTFLDNSKKIWD